MKKTPYQRIVEAARAGKGVRLSWKECLSMATDTAISQLAENDSEDQNKGGQMFIVELEQGVWLTDADGDPPRTLREANATRYDSMLEAARALTDARTFRPFINATINGA